MTAALDALKGKVQRMLTDEFGTIQVDKDGDFTLRHESARVFVRCLGWHDKTIVRVFSPFLHGIPASAELFKYAATESWVFGHVSVNEDPGSGELELSYSHTLLGDYLDAEELKTAVLAVIFTANEIDDELQAKYGGQRFHEDA